jgi:hypothetical protein
MSNGPTYSIVTTSGIHILVDPEDVKLTTEFSWYITLAKPSPPGYAIARQRNSRKLVLMHRLIMKPPAGMQVDHINHNTLDNRRSNLRIVTPAENASHRRRPKERTTSKKTRSKYVGVHKSWNWWAAQICVNYEHIRLGNFKTQEEAALVYDAAVRKYRGEFGITNFPEKAVCDVAA